MMLPPPPKVTLRSLASILLDVPLASRTVIPPPPNCETMLEPPALGSTPKVMRLPVCEVTPTPNGTATWTPFATTAELVDAVIRLTVLAGGMEQEIPLAVTTPELFGQVWAEAVSNQAADARRGRAAAATRRDRKRRRPPIGRANSRSWATTGAISVRHDGAPERVPSTPGVAPVNNSQLHSKRLMRRCSRGYARVGRKQAWRTNPALRSPRERKSFATHGGESWRAPQVARDHSASLRLMGVGWAEIAQKILLVSIALPGT